MWNFVKPDTHFFSAEQRRQVEALFEAILPGSETTPGATDANAVEYLDTLLTMDEETLYVIPQLRSLYPVGLLATEDAARRAFNGRGIVDLTLDERTLLLRQLAAGKLEGTSFSAKDQARFFTDLRTRCIEGCFGDARWGGNKDNVMWRWFGWTVPAEDFKRPKAVAVGGPKVPIKGKAAAMSTTGAKRKPAAPARRARR
jgi:hypothetical protein